MARTVTGIGPLGFLRFKRGVVGESRRTVHLVALPPVLAMSPFSMNEYGEVLTALCGQTFATGEAEALPRMMGAPCNPCLIKSPGPDDPNAGGDISPPDLVQIGA